MYCLRFASAEWFKTLCERHSDISSPRCSFRRCIESLIYSLDGRAVPIYARKHSTCLKKGSGPESECKTVKNGCHIRAKGPPTRFDEMVLQTKTQPKQIFHIFSKMQWVHSASVDYFCTLATDTIWTAQRKNLTWVMPVLPQRNLTCNV